MPRDAQRIARRRRRRRARELRWQVLLGTVRHYEAVHLTIGVMGDLCFLVGSTVFLVTSHRTLAISLYIAGAVGMLVGNVGKAVVRLGERKLFRREDMPSPT